MIPGPGCNALLALARPQGEAAMLHTLKPHDCVADLRVNILAASSYDLTTSQRLHSQWSTEPAFCKYGQPLSFSLRCGSFTFTMRSAEMCLRPVVASFLLSHA